MKFITTCAIGLENHISESIKAYATIIEVYPGIIVFECDSLEKLTQLKTVDDILYHVKKLAGVSRYRATLKNIRHQLRKSSFLKKTKDVSSFFVDVAYNGKIDYTAKEIKDLAVGEIKKKYKWKFEKENADINICINLDKNYSYVGISLNSQPLHVLRAIDTVPGSLKNSIATFMLDLANTNKNNIVLDPMCGSGVIPFEADLLGAKAIGGDIDPLRINVAKLNSDRPEYNIWDATKTDLKDKSIDKVVSNLPFGKQVDINNPEKFFEKFTDEMIRVSKRKFTWVLLTTHSIIFEKIVEKKKLKITKQINIQNSGLKSKILVITP